MSEHTLDEYGDHDEDACYECLLGKEVKCDCQCGQCCRRLIIEVGLEDVKREPQIAERCKDSPLLDAPDANGHRELIGYLLNSREDIACVFLDRETNLCTIYETRPLTCRLYDCSEEREHLIELGILTRE